MIITSSCPLRISLVGGSTDHPEFIRKYKSGRVISFPCNLKTYVTIHKDVFGANTLDKKYILNYSMREEVDNVDDIKNELIRFCFKSLDVDQINLFLTSDVFSYGSGLASSSAYLMSLIKSIYLMREESITESEICKSANEIEKMFNPLVGQQDFYGSLGGLKKMIFYESDSPDIKYLDTSIFKLMDMYLIYTGVTRSSTNILESLNIDNSLALLDDVDDLEKAINDVNIDLFHKTIKRTWINKKNTSPLICQSEVLIELDNLICDDDNILSHKLLGAGNGGYFLIFTRKNVDNLLLKKYKNINKIEISESGIKSTKI
jgi:D-glycero-alpha-D-manno-heptose-7-phosphate kinase